jgi:hypothetical protein
LGLFDDYTPEGIFTIFETDNYDPYSDDRLRLYWDHPLYPQQWSYRFCWMPIDPAGAAAGKLPRTGRRRLAPRGSGAAFQPEP